MEDEVKEEEKVLVVVCIVIVGGQWCFHSKGCLCPKAKLGRNTKFPPVLASTARAVNTVGERRRWCLCSGSGRVSGKMRKRCLSSPLLLALQAGSTSTMKATFVWNLNLKEMRDPKL